jgi:transposase
MSTKGISMRKIKTLLRLHHESKLSQHQIANSLQLSVGVVNKYLKRAKAAGLSWPLPEEYNDEALLKNRLQSVTHKPSETLSVINFAYIHQELKRKNVTLQLLWEEYRSTVLSPVSYSHFCLLYRNYKNTQPQSMRQTHKAGDKAFVDYAGHTIDIIDPDTGEIQTAQIFVGVLGASNYTYAEATFTQQLPDWIASHCRMFEFFNGVPALIIPDNLRSAINKSCRYEPDINPTYADFIEYYGTAVLPARPFKPKDKAKVENAVLIVERWVLARLRNQTFFGLAQLNCVIRELVRELNNRPFKKLPGCRLSAFEEIDKPALKLLPAYPYEFTYFKKARVHIDYHVQLDSHYYSVPYQYISKEVECRYTSTRVEWWYQGKQIAIHVRSYKKGSHTTIHEHMPKAHRKHQQWTPGRFLNWSAQIGCATTRLVKYLLEYKPHPEQGYRSCLGLLNLSKRYGDIRLEKAYEYAWQIGAKNRRSVESILIHNLENKLFTQIKPTHSIAGITHENLRSKNYYH